jgi:hypothetical protein
MVKPLARPKSHAATLAARLLRVRYEEAGSAVVRWLVEFLNQQHQTEREFAMARKSKIQNHGSDNKPSTRNNAFPSGL